MHKSLPAKRPVCDDILRHRSNPPTTPSPLHASANFLDRLIVQRRNKDVCQCVRSYIEYHAYCVIDIKSTQLALVAYLQAATTLAYGQGHLWDQ